MKHQFSRHWTLGNKQDDVHEQNKQHGPYSCTPFPLENFQVRTGNLGKARSQKWR